MLCLLEADWTLGGCSFTVEAMHVFWPRPFIQRMTMAALADIDVLRPDPPALRVVWVWGSVDRAMNSRSG